MGFGAGEPGLFRSENFFQSFVRSFPVSGAKLQIRDVGDPAIVFVAPKKIDVVFH